MQGQEEIGFALLALVAGMPPKHFGTTAGTENFS